MNSGANPRMRDVALRCGVSESTVSHVLNGTKKVAEQTREKILAAIRELNYHRDSDARRLARGRSNFLGLIISDIENPFYPGLIKSFETAAIEFGYEMLLCTTNYQQERTESAFRKMIENKVPGVAVMTSRVEPSMADYLAEQGIASVFLDSVASGAMRSNIRVDYMNGVAGAVNHLHHMGHRDFALVAGPQDRASHVAYREAFELALEHWKLVPRIIEGNNDSDSGEQAVTELLTAKRLPTAILCSNDVTAMSVIRAFAKCGVRVPEDVSVVGADDIPVASLTQPPLTTVRMPRERLGALALQTLHEMLSTRSQGGVELTVETELILRETTRIACQIGA